MRDIDLGGAISERFIVFQILPLTSTLTSVLTPR
jgi:hypothetical protein